MLYMKEYDMLWVEGTRAEVEANREAEVRDASNIEKCVNLLTNHMRLDRWNGQERVRAIAAAFGFMHGVGYGPKSSEMANLAIAAWGKVPL